MRESADSADDMKRSSGELPAEKPEADRNRRASTPSLTSGEISVSVKRMSLTQAAFDELHFKATKLRTPLTNKIRSQCYCSKKRLWKIVSTYLPLLKVIRYYRVREYLLVDLLAGITVGIMHIPQALGFGMLTSVKTVNGLYTSFWPVVMYLFFGTSPHVSIGTSAVICILTASIVDKEAEWYKTTFYNDSLPTNVTYWENLPEYMDFKEGTAMTTSLIAGAILLLMGILRLGFITAYLSESFFNAFTSGVAVHIATSQVAAMFGLKIAKYSGAFKIIKTYRDIFSNIASTNFAELIVASCSIVDLVVVNECVKERFKAKFKVPIPNELLVVVIGTAVSYAMRLEQTYGVDVVGHIQTEIPAPVVPPLGRVSEIFVDSLIIAILIFANTIAMAKICAKKHNYEVDDSQELIAYGMCNFVSAFMYCFPSSIAPPRSMVASSMNTKSQLNSAFTAVLMFLIITVISNLFESLPKSILAAVIVVALKGLFVQIGDVRKFWKINKFDFVIWVSTFLGVVFLDIDLGLGLGMGVGLITVVFQTQFARGYRIGRTLKDGILVENNRYGDSVEIPGIKIYRFQSNLYFANAEVFRSMLYRSTINPRKLLKLLQKREERMAKLKKVGIKPASSLSQELSPSDLLAQSDSVDSTSKQSVGQRNSVSNLENPVFTISPEDFSEINEKTGQKNNMVSYLSNGKSFPTSAGGSTRTYSDGSSIHRTASTGSSITLKDEEEDPEDGSVMVSEEKLQKMKSIHHIILDCSTINYLDASGANVLSHIFTEYNHVNIKFFLAGCSYDMRKTMHHGGVYDKIPSDHIFVDLLDAISRAKTEILCKMSIDLSDFSDEEAAEDSYVTKL